jgi:hypothetical protein
MPWKNERGAIRLDENVQRLAFNVQEGDKPQIAQISPIGGEGQTARICST